MFNKQHFIKKANNIHKNKYDYTNVSYVNSKTKIEIICPIHGSFWQFTNNHLSGNKMGEGCIGNGCPKCNGEKHKHWNRTINKRRDDFIKRANGIHGNKYNYDNIEYLNVRTPIYITCLIHGDFKQSPGHHIFRKQGCPQCAKRSQGNAKMFYGDDNTEARVYFINFFNDEENFYKIGITCNEKRFWNRHLVYNIKHLYAIKVNQKQAGWVEQQFKEIYNKYKYEPKTKFGGWTECFVFETCEISTIITKIEEIIGGE